jgi:serine/threonine protein kinase
MEVVDLSRYDVQETLGKGGMGEVLLAMDTHLERKVRSSGCWAMEQSAGQR